MLFSSLEFIVVYLPVVLGVYFLLAGRSRMAGGIWLALASLAFYGWWDASFLALLLSSIVFNYGAGGLIVRWRGRKRAKTVLTVAIVANLTLLAFFKYLNFFIDTANGLGASLPLLDIVLPLGISFFTFTQIAFLVDVHAGHTDELNFIHYVLFVTWFPHLIAGPILHHAQMMPQFASPKVARPDGDAFAVGLTLFAIGMFKKVILADNFAVHADAAFADVAAGAQPKFFEAWVGALTYTLQLYFDFSGYTDMALGISKLFNIKLPLNFNSPYKAENIIEFWRRWHMTLSTFLRDYLYVPLGGNRKGRGRRYVNLMLTMLLGGLWHGAGWTFVVWGGLHGLYLVVNHAWRALIGTHTTPSIRTVRVGMLLTFLAVVVAWVPFRAVDMNAAMIMWKGMAGFHGMSMPGFLEPAWRILFADDHGVAFVKRVNDISASRAVAWIVAGLWIVWCLPNSQQWLAHYAPAWDKADQVPRSRFVWRPQALHWAVVMGVVFAASVLSLKKNSPFLYFQF